MTKNVSTLDQFEARRRKEYFAFLVVKFFKAHAQFQAIHEEYQKAADDESLARSGLYTKVWDLGQTLSFDLKEKAHYLFRSENKSGKPAQERSPEKTEKDTRRLIQELKSSSEARSIDSYIATGYHLLLILGESLYQLKRYTPEFEKERDQIGKIERLARSIGYTFSSEEENELEHLRALSDISMKVGSDTEELIHRLMERCESLFKGTAEVIWHFIESSGENEVLVQNLLLNVDLFEKVYGEGSSERIFWILCRHKKLDGRTGREKAVNYARLRCGNVSGIA